MVSLFSIIAVAFACQYARAKEFHPRDELFASMTSGERNYLRALEKDTVIDHSPSASPQNTSPGNAKVSSLHQEVLQFTRTRGHPINFNSTIVQSGELMRTKLLAEGGSVEAAYFLGLFYLYGLESLFPDEATAIDWFRKSANGGHNDARCALGLLLYQVDKSQAMSYFRLASRDGHSYGHWLYGRSLFEMVSTIQLNSDENNTRRMMKEAASLFNEVAREIPAAAHQLGIMYEYGLVDAEINPNFQTSPSTPNFAKAAEFYEIASQQGHVESIHHLGLMYAYGRGFTQDFVKAAQLFRQAANHQLQPYPPSMRYLAIILVNGYAHPPDVDTALSLYDRCSEQTHFKDIQKLCKKEREDLINLIDVMRLRVEEQRK
jgi:TPR repeat protein